MTTVSTTVVHQWKLVAPWWHWPTRDTTDPTNPGTHEARRSVRLTRPVFQKYETPDLVNTFLAQPQRRLRFTDDDIAFERSTTTVHRRKLFLASHHRHYLVVCSMHCDTAGFPHARTDDVCETGFVVRRRVLDLPGGPEGEIAQQLRAHATARAKRIAVERDIRTLRAPSGLARVRLTTLEARRQRWAEREGKAHAEILRSAASAGPLRSLEGWVPTGVDGQGEHAPLPACRDKSDLVPLAGVGAWREVAELPESLEEAWYPLSPLVADPRDGSHDAARETIYFGLVPTGSSDLDRDQNARFDDEQDYEIRCFVRRHRLECPRSGGHCTCPITWSEPTEAYRLASFFDLAGTANRATTVQMPDIEQLKADAARLGPGGAGGLRFKSPPGSELNFTSDDVKVTKSASNAATQICSFAIPLITIVALFVLRLFLPIVVLIFQLWFLLSLRFCLPPEGTLDPDLAADLDALGDPDVDLDAAVNLMIANDSTPLVTTLSRALGSFQGTGSDGHKTLKDAFIDDSRRSDRDTREVATTVRGVLVRDIAPLGVLTFEPRIEREQVVRP